MISPRLTAGPSRSRTRRAALCGFLATACAASILHAAPAEAPTTGPPEAATTRQSPSGAASPATLRPVPSLVLPGWEIPGSWNRGVSEGSSGIDLRSDVFRPSFTAAAGSLRPILFEDLPDQFVGRMAREAGRPQRGALASGWNLVSPDDSLGEAERSRVAERVITRSFHRSLDRGLEAMAEATPGLGTALDWLQGLGPTLRHGGQGRTDTPAGGQAQVPDRGRFEGSVRLRVDAHPRIQMGAEYKKFRGRIELPLLSGDPLRLTLDRPITPRTAASLSGNLGRDGRSWATLAFTLGF